MDTHQLDPHTAEPADAAPDAPLAARMGTCGRARTTRERGEWRLAMLEELAEIGMESARAIGQQVVDAVKATPLGEAPSKEVVRAEAALRSASRSVRQAVALHAKLEKQQLALDATAESGEGGQSGGGSSAGGSSAGGSSAAEQGGRGFFRSRARRFRRKAMVKRAIERAYAGAIENLADPSDDEGYEHLLDDLFERMDEYEEFADFAEDPVSALVGGICRGLGIEPCWRDYVNEPWAIEEIRLKPPGSVYADWPEGDPADAGRERGPP